MDIEHVVVVVVVVVVNLLLDKNLLLKYRL
jgi:hypothetical protein